jgi:hypothetical protein
MNYMVWANFRHALAEQEHPCSLPQQLPFMDRQRQKDKSQPKGADGCAGMQVPAFRVCHSSGCHLPLVLLVVAPATGVVTMHTCANFSRAIAYAR